MRHFVLVASIIAAVAAPAAAQQQPLVAQPKADAASARFEAVLQQALGALAKAGNYALDVESKWGAVNDPAGPQGGSRYRLISQGAKYRVEVQSPAAQSPELLCVCDGNHVTTYLAARKLYSQHAADSPQASIEANTILSLSLQGSAIDILLRRDVASFVRTQSSDLKDHGLVKFGAGQARHFELFWAGAKSQLWFAAEGDPLLLQYTRTTIVPTADDLCYEQACTAKFHWKLGVSPPQETFAIALPQDARRVSDIYDALSGEDAAARVGKPLPRAQLSKLDGDEVELATLANQQATVLIFWATWCASSVEDMAAISQIVKTYKDRGIAFYAVNVGEQPGEVRRFTAKSPLVSTILLDPRGSASSALRITQLPAIAVVGPDNTVRAILHGTSRDLLGQLSAQLEPLLRGSANTARRPDETTVPK